MTQKSLEKKIENFFDSQDITVYQKSHTATECKAAIIAWLILAALSGIISTTIIVGAILISADLW